MMPPRLWMLKLWRIKSGVRPSLLGCAVHSISTRCHVFVFGPYKASGSQLMNMPVFSLSTPVWYQFAEGMDWVFSTVS